MAKQCAYLLAACASSAGVERVFSARRHSGGRMHDVMRKSQKDESLKHSLFAARSTPKAHSMHHPSRRGLGVARPFDRSEGGVGHGECRVADWVYCQAEHRTVPTAVLRVAGARCPGCPCEDERTHTPLRTPRPGRARRRPPACGDADAGQLMMIPTQLVSLRVTAGYS